MSITDRPLQVFLDSNDISNLASPSKRSEEVVSVENQLIRWRDAGLIEIRFSYSLVMEAAPLSPKDSENFVLRARKIEELCKRKALAALDTVLEVEFRALQKKCAISKDFIFMDNGRWMPSLSPNIPGTQAINHKSKIIELLSKEGLNDFQIQQALPKFLTQNGKPRYHLKKKLRAMVPHTMNSLRELFPLDEATCYRFANQILDDKFDDVEFASAISTFFCDLNLFAKWFVVQHEIMAPTASWIRQNGQETAKSLSAIRKNMDGLIQSQISYGISPAKINKTNKDNFRTSMQNSIGSVVPDMALKFGVEGIENVNYSKMDQIAPGLYTQLGFWWGSARKTLLPLTNARSPELSDAGDMLHCMYLPYVDVFRADRYAGGVLKELKLPFPTLIVTNFLELPDVISKRLEQGAASITQPK